MSKIEINFELLDLFNEEEINTVCKNADLTFFFDADKGQTIHKVRKKIRQIR